MLNLEMIDGDHVVASSNSCMLTLWRGATRPEAMFELRALSLDIATRNSHQIGFLTIVEATASLPNTAARAELARIFQSLGPSVACAAVVFEGSGFRAAAVRAISGTINQMARQTFPSRVFATVPEAVRWMTSIGEHFKFEQLDKEMAKMREALDLHTGKPIAVGISA